MTSNTLHILIILGIILLCGLLGGLANWVLRERYIRGTGEPNMESNGMQLREYLVLGVVASFVVPLFLNMISSNLLADTHDEPYKWFVFAGFCLLAAVFSRSFLESMYSKVIKMVGDVNEKVKNVDKKVGSVEKDVTIMSRTLTDPEVSLSEFDKKEIDESILTKENLESDEYNVLKAMMEGRRVYRSMSGLWRDAKLSEKDKQGMKNHLEQMVHKGLLEEHPTPKGSPRWNISEKGRDLLEKLSQDEGAV